MEQVGRLGWMGPPLVLVSVLGLALMGERAVYFWRNRSRRTELEAALLGGSGAVPKGCQGSPLGQVAKGYLGARERGAGASRRAAEVRLERWVHRARSPVKQMAMLAHIAPMLGLTGTVLGLVEAFRVIETSEQAISPALLAGGIWEALLTTVAGMMISIPLIIAIRLCNARIEDAVCAAMEWFAWLEETFPAGGRTQGKPEGSAPTHPSGAGETKWKEQVA